MLRRGGPYKIWLRRPCFARCSALSTPAISRLPPLDHVRELYGSVINVLVDSRDQQREVLSWTGPPFDLREKLSLLGPIARYLAESQKSEIQLKRSSDDELTSEKTATEIIEEQLRRMPTAQVTGEQALNYLKERSIVFRKIAPNIAIFAHKTFQEYLAAATLAQESGVDILLAHVNDPAWRQIIIFAAKLPINRCAVADNRSHTRHCRRYS